MASNSSLYTPKLNFLRRKSKDASSDTTSHSSSPNSPPANESNHTPVTSSTSTSLGHRIRRSFDFSSNSSSTSSSPPPASSPVLSPSPSTPITDLHSPTDNYRVILQLHSHTSAPSIEKHSSEPHVNKPSGGGHVSAQSIGGAALISGKRHGETLNLRKKSNHGAKVIVKASILKSKPKNRKILSTKEIGVGVVRFTLVEEHHDWDESKDQPDEELSQSRSISVNAKDEKEATKLHEKFQQVAHELVTTEKSYVTNLNTLIHEIVHPLRKDLLGGLVTVDQVHTLFSNVEVLASLQQKLLSELEHSEDKPAKPLLKYSDFFKMYSVYCSNYIVSIELLHNLRQIPEFKQFMDLKRDSEHCKGQDLASYLILPVQRLPRYELLLKQLLKYVHDENSEECKDLRAALDKVQSITSMINETNLEAERTMKLFHIQDKLKGASSVTVFVASRHVLDEVRLEELTPGPTALSRKIARIRHLFIFNDMLMWTNEGYEYRGHCILSKRGIYANEYHDRDCGKLHCFELGILTNSFLFACESKDMKNDIIQKILEAIDNL